MYINLKKVPERKEKSMVKAKAVKKDDKKKMKVKKGKKK